MQESLNNIQNFRQIAIIKNLTKLFFCAILISQLKFMTSLFVNIDFKFLKLILLYSNFNSSHI